MAIAGPRGDPTRRTRTRPIPVELRLGRYDINGSIHAIPGTDPIIGFRRRRMMVPLTEATIEFDSPDGRELSRFGTILVNRDLTDWIAPASRLEVRPLEVVPEIEDRGLAKDFTSQLQVHEVQVGRTLTPASPGRSRRAVGAEPSCFASVGGGAGGSWRS